MSKYGALWAYIQKSGRKQLTLTFEKAAQLAGVPLDRSLCRTKKLTAPGYQVKKSR